MSILIKGVSIPTEGQMPVTVSLFPDGRVEILRLYCGEWETGQAVEIPSPHGRLIDADALAVMASKRMGVINIWHIYEAKTVIEAEEG